MKNVILIIVLLFMGGILCTSIPENNNGDIIRIHIRANSNETLDQNIKYLVKDALVAYLTPLLANATSFEAAEAQVNTELPNLIGIANRTLASRGYTYTSSASIRQENFPIRVYDDIVFEAGVYNALIVELGEGTGDNWWCVLYPPLCFIPAETNGGNFTYRSKILEIIESYKSR